LCVLEGHGRGEGGMEAWIGRQVEYVGAAREVGEFGAGGRVVAQELRTFQGEIAPTVEACADAAGQEPEPFEVRRPHMLAQGAGKMDRGKVAGDEAHGREQAVKGDVERGLDLEQFFDVARVEVHGPSIVVDKGKAQRPSAIEFLDEAEKT
jgi:hypothetical protein